MATVNNRTAREMIRVQKEFKTHTGALSARWFKPGEYFSYGQMSREDHMIIEKRMEDQPVYAIISYDTIIGTWADDGQGFWRTDKKYSVTTSKQVGMIPIS